MTKTRRFTETLLDYIDDSIHRNIFGFSSNNKLILGGVSGSGGGWGEPWGGVVGQLAQKLVCYDFSEEASMCILPSSSLLDNLNHIRHHLLPATWFELSPQEPRTTRVNVGSGLWWYGTNDYLEFPGGESPIITMPSTHPRVDVIYVNTSGIIGVNEGTEASNPVLTLPSGTVLTVGTVRVIPSFQWIGWGCETYSGYIHKDLRPFLGGIGGGAGEGDQWITVTSEGKIDFNPELPAMCTTDGVITEYATIQAAINAAVSGQFVLIPPGTYDENITLKDGVTVAELVRDTVTITATGGTIAVTSVSGGFINVREIRMVRNVADSIYAIYGNHSGTCEIKADLYTQNNHANGFAYNIRQLGSGTIEHLGNCEAQNSLRTSYGICADAGVIYNTGDIETYGLGNSGYGIRTDGGTVYQKGKIYTQGGYAYAVRAGAGAGTINVIGDIEAYSETQYAFGIDIDTSDGPTVKLRGNITAKSTVDVARGVYIYYGQDGTIDIIGDIDVTSTTAGTFGMDIMGGDVTHRGNITAHGGNGATAHARGINLENGAPTVTWLRGKITTETVAGAAHDIYAWAVFFSGDLYLGDVNFDLSKVFDDGDFLAGSNTFKGSKARHTRDLDQSASGEPVVVGLHGRDIASTAPTDGQAYVWMAGAWHPHDVGGGGGMTTIVTQIVAPRWHADGSIATADEVDGVWLASSDYRIDCVTMYLATVGSVGNTIVDIEKSEYCGSGWTTVFPNQSNRPSLAGGTSCHTASGYPGTPQVLTAGTLLRMNIEEVASGAQNLSVQITGITQEGLSETLLTIMGIA